MGLGQNTTHDEYIDADLPRHENMFSHVGISVQNSSRRSITSVGTFQKFVIYLRAVTSAQLNSTKPWKNMRDMKRVVCICCS